MLHDVRHPENNQTAPPIAEQRKAAYQAASLPSRPVAEKTKLRSLVVRSWLLAGALGLLVGTAGTLGATSQLAPLAGAQRVTNAEVVITNDDSRWFIVSAWAVRLPSPLVAGESE